MANPFADMDLVCLFSSPLAVVKKVVTKQGDDKRPEWQRKAKDRTAKRLQKKAWQKGDEVGFVDPDHDVPLDTLAFADNLKQDLKDKQEMHCIDVLDTEAEWLAIQHGLKEADLSGKRQPLTQERLSQAVLADPQILIISGCLMEELKDKKAWAHRCRPLGVDAKLLSDAAAKPKKKRKLQLVCLSTPCSKALAIFLRQTLQVPHVVYFDGVPDDVLKPVFFQEFFDAMVGNKPLSVGQAFEQARQEVAKQRRDPERHLLEEDPDFYKLEAAKYTLLSVDESARLALGKGHFSNETPTVPHNELPAFLRGPDEWAEPYQHQRNREMLELLSTVVEGQHDTYFLWGPAGMGKSMMAKRIANYSFSSRSRFEGGVFYIDRRRAQKQGKELEPVEHQVARALAQANERALKYKIEDLAKDPWKVIRQARAEWGKLGTILMVLDNMDPHSVGEKHEEQLEELLRSLTSKEKVEAPAMRVLVVGRAWPSVALQHAGGLFGESVYDRDDDDEFAFKSFAVGKEPVRQLNHVAAHEALEVLCELRSGEKESAQGPWKWKREADTAWWAPDKHELSHLPELDEETELWLVWQLLQCNPGMVREARKVAVQKKVGRPQDFRQAWTDTHGEMEAYIEGGDFGVKKYRLPADKRLQLFGAGDVSSEGCAPIAGGSGWHDWSDDGESDSVHGRDRRHRRRRGDGGCRRGGRRHRRHRSRRREGAGKSRLRELREEHERLLAENRDLKGSVRRIEAILRRGLRV